MLVATPGFPIDGHAVGHYKLELIAFFALIAAHVDAIVFTDHFEIAGARQRTPGAIGVVKVPVLSKYPSHTVIEDFAGPKCLQHL